MRRFLIASILAAASRRHRYGSRSRHDRILLLRKRSLPDRAGGLAVMQTGW